MTMKSLCLALSLVSVFSSAALANDRYRERPPVIVSPDLSAPWLMQLGGGSARPVVVPQRQTVRPV
jgi:hypothetical protein